VTELELQNERKKLIDAKLAEQQQTKPQNKPDSLPQSNKESKEAIEEDEQDGGPEDDAGEEEGEAEGNGEAEGDGEAEEDGEEEQGENEGEGEDEEDIDIGAEEQDQVTKLSGNKPAVDNSRKINPSPLTTEGNLNSPLKKQ